MIFIPFDKIFQPLSILDVQDGEICLFVN